MLLGCGGRSEGRDTRKTTAHFLARAAGMQASALYRQHHNEAALSLYTEALKLQQRLLGKQQQLDEATGGVSASNLSLMENTAKLAFNKARSGADTCCCRCGPVQMCNVLASDSIVQCRSPVL